MKLKLGAGNFDEFILSSFFDSHHLKVSGLSDKYDGGGCIEVAAIEAHAG